MKELFCFLKELRENNNREWFQEHKNEFDVLRKVFEFQVQELIEQISLFDDEIRGLQAKDCVFRIYRDTRFAYDKTPYKEHLGAWIARGGRKSERAGYYFHVEPDNCLFAGGIWHPDPKLLKMVRDSVFEHIDEFKTIINNKEFKKVYHKISGDTLKTVPRPYPKDFPDAVYLKLKDYIAECHKPDDFFNQEDWVMKAAQEFKLLYPLNRFLNFTVDDYI